MKNLLFTSLLLLVVGSIGCSNKNSPKTDGTSTQQTTVVSDSGGTASQGQPATPSTSNPASGQRGDSAKVHSVTHGAPNQAEIDSIKAAKTKGKK